MVSLLTDLVKPYLEKLIDEAIGEFRYVCCFTSIAEEFKEEQAKLREERKTMEQRVGERQKKVDQLLQEDIKTKRKCFFGFCPDCIWRYKRGKELADKIVNMKQLVDKGEKLTNIEISRCLPGVEFHSSQSYIHFKGRELEYKELLKALKDENNFTTGLHGMGGSGKTTLAKKVGKELKQSETFAHVIDVTVSYTPDIKKIQDAIAGPLGLEWEDCNESNRPKKLWSRLTDGEKILLILDDVWDQKPPLDFDAIGIPKQDNHKGCRVLVTTHNKRVLTKMGCDKKIKLGVLSKEDSRIMFESYAGITNNSSKSLIDKGRKIADACKRLPVAIAAVASSLKGQESIEEWDFALKSLQNPMSSIQGDDESLVEIYNCLKFSYDYLKDEKVKRLFLLCSVFPEDKEIDVEILTRLSLGAGLFGEDIGSYNDARNQVVVDKNKLLDSCMLLEGDEGCVKMHDLVRDAAQWIANQEIRTVNMSHKGPKSLIDRDNNTKYLFWKGKVKEMFSSSFGGSKLEILIAAFDADGDGDYVEVPNSFFETMAGLRVLYLDYKQNSYNPLAFSLPRSIQSLMNIRSLLVGRAHLGDISVLGNLKCLETLDLEVCKITELPHEITKLEKFKLLKLIRCKIRRNNPFEVIEKCLFLDELYFQDSFNKFCKEINFFPKLQPQRYYINTQSGDVSVSKSVELASYKYLNIFSEATMKYFFQTTQYLVLESIKWQWRNLIPEIVPVDQGMNDLVLLDLRNSSELQYLIKVVGSQVPSVFSKLVVLKLHGMEKLEELCNGPLSFDSLKALEELSISWCRNLRSLLKFNLDLCSLKKVTLKECPLLVSLFQLSTAKGLIMLEELKIDDCGQLESIIADEKSGEESKEEILVDDGDSDNKKHSSMFLKLKVLDIANCPQLEFILPFLSEDLLVPILETISIESCDKLKYIFDQFVELGSLKDLKLHQLPNFIGIFPESGHLMPLFAKESSSNLKDTSYAKSLIMLEKLKIDDRGQLESIIADEKSGEESKEEILVDDGDSDNKKYSSMFPKLKVLDIASCPQLEFILPFLSEDLPAPIIETISIESCDKLKYIFDQFVELGSLKDLKLHQLPNFIGIFPESGYLMPLFAKTSASTLRDDFKAPTQLDPIKFNVFSWTQKCCYGLKYKHKLRSTTSTKISLVSKDQSQHCPISSERAQCFSRKSEILCNITTIELSSVSNIKSVFMLSIARRMLHLLETLIIANCDELKHIIVDTGDDNGGNNSSNVFPRLKKLKIDYCEQLEYIFGHYVDDHQSHNEIHLHFPELKSLHLKDMPNLVAICPKQYHTTFPSLVYLELNNCSPIASKSIGDFISLASSTSLESTTMKRFSGQPQILHNITTIKLIKVSKIKSVFILSTARRMLQLETLTIEYCDELKHIIIIDSGDDNGGNNSSNVFPRLKELKVDNCEQLEYIFGHYADDHQSHNEIHLHLPKLKSLHLEDMPNLVAMCPKQYHTTFPSLVNLELVNCSQVASKSIGDFISHTSSTSLDNATIKELNGNVEHFLALQQLEVTNFKVENVLFLNITNGQQLNLMLQYIWLYDLHAMTYLFVGPKSSVTLHNLTKIEIGQCEKLEIMFSTCVVRCFPQLVNLRIEKCKDLKHVIEEDAEDEMMSNTGTCFPKLQTLVVRNCNKLEFVFPVSICKELHELKVLMIREANALQEVFRSKDAQKVEIPNLKVIVFVNLPSLSQTQAIEFQNVEHRLVENCQKLSLNSVSTLSDREIYDLDWGVYEYIQDRKEKDLATGTEVQATWEHELSSSESFKTSVEEGTMLDDAKIITSSTPLESVSSSSGPLVASEHKTSSNEVGSEKIFLSWSQRFLSWSQRSLSWNQRAKDGNVIAETSKDISIGVKVQAASVHKLTSSQEFLNEPSTSQQHPIGEADTTVKPASQGNNCLEETKDQSIQEILISEKATTTIMGSFKRSDEQGTTLDNVNTVTTPTPIELASSSSMPLVISEHKTSLHVKDDEISVSEPKPSPTTSYEGNSSSLIRKELQQLVSKKHLGSENLTLLTDFLVKYPSVRLRDNSLSNRYKGYAYNCLAELLKFLQTHSVLDVLETSHSEFVELLQDARSFNFDKNWLDGVEKRAFLLPYLQHSQHALEKLFHSKQQVSQHVEELKHQLASSEAHLESIIQQEAQVLESRAALSAPLGY